MKFVLFYHSLLSDWNHGNAHFLRGIVSELLGRGHAVEVYEPAGGWSLSNLLQEHGQEPLQQFQRAYPGLNSLQYDLAALDLETALDGADVVIVHEWTDPALVNRIAAHHAENPGRTLLFHDTHHRLISEPEEMAELDLWQFDGVLAYGEVLRCQHLRKGKARRAWVWHEAADVRKFRPLSSGTPAGDLVWIGNWGDEERTEELQEFLIEPVRALGLKACVYGVRYPEAALRLLSEAGIEYRGWLPNFAVPEVFAQFKATIHIPRRPYVQALPGIPTIRVFEALACGIPLVCAPWEDREHLFNPGTDYLVARTGKEMKRRLSTLMLNAEERRTLRDQGRQTILRRHTCAHRVEELLGIIGSLRNSL
jgi:spore maturation protein CgeB